MQYLPGPVQPSSDQQDPHDVGVQCRHLKLQLRSYLGSRIPPGFHGNQAGFGDAGVEAAVHQAADVADPQFIHSTLKSRAQIESHTQFR